MNKQQTIVVTGVSRGLGRAMVEDFTKLLSFVALFGILLSPIGAIVFIEHWLFPRIGFRRYWFSSTGQSISWPALWAWTISVAIALGLWFSQTLHEFFIAIPLWFVSAALYTIFAALAGAKGTGSDAGDQPESVAHPPQQKALVDSVRPPWLRAIGFAELACRRQGSWDARPHGFGQDRAGPQPEQGVCRDRSFPDLPRLGYSHLGSC